MDVTFKRKKDNFVPIPFSATFTLSADIFVGTEKKKKKKHSLIPTCMYNLWYKNIYGLLVTY